ncbi:MAG: zinc-ribbon domain-containing protein, partial [Fibrobacter sp.]|nr:zinc-ribbon domain-containing protein [Fibrobacter sp.]
MGKFCTRCGTPMNEGAKFCDSCGAASQQKPLGMGKFISQYIRKSLKVLKDPKQMIPTIVLGLFWLVLALLGSFGINPLPVRILSFLTFAQGGMFGGVLGAIGGILGKVVVAAFLNAFIIPLFQKKAPFTGLGGGIKSFFRS